MTYKVSEADELRKTGVADIIPSANGGEVVTVPINMTYKVPKADRLLWPDSATHCASEHTLLT